MKVTVFIASLPEDELSKRQFPLGPGFIQSYVQQRHPDVEFLITADSEEAIASSPDLLGISSVSQCFPQAMDVAARAKREIGVPVILGGYHISCLPHRLPPEFDVGVRGEGEQTMTRLVELFARTGAMAPEDLAEIPGLTYRDATGETVVNAPTAPITPLDSLPSPARNISRGARNIHIFTSRGCVYRCRFCASSRFWGKFRAHSARYVVDALRELIDVYDATSIQLLDDLFFANKRRVREIAELMSSEGLAGTLSFGGFISSNLADREMLEVARTMGFTSLRFGAETASDRLLKDMKGPHASAEYHQRCVDLCSELGIEVRAAFMLGTPGETEEDLQETYRFLKRNAAVLKIDGFYLTTPIPGTSYWDLAREKGLVSEDMDWSHLNLDILKRESFDFERAIYLNADNVPLATTIEYAHRFQEEFSFYTAPPRASSPEASPYVATNSADPV